MNRSNKEHNTRIVNPYNFIPFLDKCERSKPFIEAEDCHTGYFECQMRLLTPLFIPNTSSDVRLVTEKERGEVKDAKGYDFFSYDDWPVAANNGKFPSPPQEPVIPGSEIRGTVRSVYEAAFNGCLSSVSAKRVLSRRSNEVKKAGILRKQEGQWWIEPCKRAMLWVGDEKSKLKGSQDKTMGKKVLKNTYDKWPEGQELWVKLTDYDKKSKYKPKVVTDWKEIEDKNVRNSVPITQSKISGNAGFVRGFLHKGEPCQGKHHESVFYQDTNAKEKGKRIWVDEIEIERLEKVCQEYRESTKPSHSEYQGYEVHEEGTLIYYYEGEKNDGHVYLSPACIGKEVFDKTVEELLEENGDYGSCDDDNLCPACQIFGMVGASGSYACGSKVRFSDAKLIQPTVDSADLFEDPVILPELGEPKPGTVEFYTESPYGQGEQKNAQGYWTYDYKHITGSGKKTVRKTLPKGLPKLRGRKYYWHKELELKKGWGEKELSAMKQRIRPLKGQKPNDLPLFKFRIYFEQLSIQQLNELRWALDFGNPDCAHKMGRVKPLGFGSVQIIVGALKLRNINSETGAWELQEQPEEFYVQQIKENMAREAVQTMANWKEKPENVSYPCVAASERSDEAKKNDSASHQWFSINKGRPFAPNFMKVLPKVNEDADAELNEKKALYQASKRNVR